jgi:hypothetical protein
MELKVMIHFDKTEGNLYYKSPLQAGKMTEVTAKDIKTVKTSPKVKA